MTEKKINFEKKIRAGSLEHNECVKLICEKLNLSYVQVIGNFDIKGQYFPDAKNDTTDYEVEVIPYINYLKIKKNRWDSTRKKVLILKLRQFAVENFDEIYLNKNDEIIKIY